MRKRPCRLAALLVRGAPPEHSEKLGFDPGSSLMVIYASTQGHHDPDVPIFEIYDRDKKIDRKGKTRQSTAHLFLMVVVGIEAGSLELST